MKTIVFDNDITILYTEATSFPDGVMEAYKKLHDYVPFSPNRKFLSVSRPEGGSIVYRAGAEVIFDNEAVKFDLATMTIPKGNYLTITLNNFIEDIPAMKTAFETLMKQPGIDPDSWCVEWYFNDTDAHCMIRLAK